MRGERGGQGEEGRGGQGEGVRGRGGQGEGGERREGGRILIKTNCISL